MSIMKTEQWRSGYFGMYSEFYVEYGDVQEMNTAAQ